MKKAYIKEKNKRILCKCRCGKTLWKISKDGRIREYIYGHNMRGKNNLGKKNKPSWNKGLNKYNNKSVLKNSESTSKFWQSNPKKRRETGKKISMSLQGVSEKQWKGYITNKGYPLEFDNKLKDKIRIRDNYKCNICNEIFKNNLCVHHIDYDKNNNNENNLISLCNKHHVSTNGNRKYWIEFFQNLMNEKYKYQYKNKLLFSAEVPIHSLYELHKTQDYLFIIGHELLKSKEYFDYCRNSKKFKILDNSSYELKKSICPKQLKQLAEKINANVIVVPDVIFNKKESEKMEKEFKNLFTLEERKKYKFMKVVCGNTVKEYKESLKEVINDEDVDLIGISRSRTMIMPNLSYVMNLFKEYAKDIKEYSKPVHLLGLSHPHELLEAKKWNRIKSIDSGLAVNFAFKNREFPKIKRADEFKRISGEDLDTEKELNITLAKKNIKILKEYYQNA